MSKKRYVLYFLFSVLLLFINGCNLARTGGDGTQSRDILIGAAITKQEIEKINAIITWEDEWIDTLEFGTLDCNYFIYTTRQMEDGSIVYSAAGTKGVDGHSKYSTIDEISSIELVINSYLVPEEADEVCSVYINPIRMTKEGEIYADKGVLLSLKTEDGMQGASVGKTINETEILTFDAGEKEVSVKVNVNLQLADHPVKHTFTEMTKDHQEVKKTEYEPGSVPEVIIAEKETDYILIETELAGVLGKNRKEFKICSWDGETIYQDEDDVKAEEHKASLTDTFYKLPDGLLRKNSTWVIWPES